MRTSALLHYLDVEFRERIHRSRTLSGYFPESPEAGRAVRQAEMLSQFRGRLLCGSCQKLPPKDVRLETADNTYYYFKADIFKGEITYSTDKHVPANLVTLTAAEAWDMIARNKAGEKPLTLKEENEKEKKPSEYSDILGQDSLTRFDKKRRRTAPAPSVARTARTRRNLILKTLKR